MKFLGNSADKSKETAEELVTALEEKRISFDTSRYQQLTSLRNELTQVLKPAELTELDGFLTGMRVISIKLFNSEASLDSSRNIVTYRIDTSDGTNSIRFFEITKVMDFLEGLIQKYRSDPRIDSLNNQISLWWNKLTTITKFRYNNVGQILDTWMFLTIFGPFEYDNNMLIVQEINANFDYLIGKLREAKNTTDLVKAIDSTLSSGTSYARSNAILVQICTFMLAKLIEPLPAIKGLSISPRLQAGLRQYIIRNPLSLRMNGELSKLEKLYLDKFGETLYPTPKEA